LAGLEIQGKKRRGKAQLHIDEAKRFVAEALKQPDEPLSVACAAMVYTGIMGLQVRDLDAGGSIVWVEHSKIAFRPFLLALAQGRSSQAYLFDFQSQGIRSSKDERKQRLLRRTRSLCEMAGLPVVCSHSMRGLHSALAAGVGITGHAMAKALGHTSFAVTKRHYVNQEVLENANLRMNLQVLEGGQR
jgi:integrase